MLPRYRPAFRHGHQVGQEYRLLARRARPPPEEQGVGLGQVLALHEEPGEGRVPQVGRGGGQHDLRIAGQRQPAGLGTVVGQRDAADLDVVAGRHGHFGEHGDAVIGAPELGHVGVETHGGGLRAARLWAGRRPTTAPRPHGPARRSRCPSCRGWCRPASGSGSTSCQRLKPPPAAVISTPIAAVGQQVDLRQWGVTGARSRAWRPGRRLGRCIGRALSAAGTLQRGTAGHLLVQQQFDALERGSACKRCDHRIVLQIVGQGQQDHALMVRHVGATIAVVLAQRAGGTGEVHRLVEAVGPAHSRALQARQVLDHGLGVGSAGPAARRRV